MNLQEKIIAIANYHGLENQLTKLSEEGAELAAATLKGLGLLLKESKCSNPKKLERIRRKKKLAEEKAKEEVADVLLVARQIEYLMLSAPKFEKKITELMQQKAEREISRIKEEEQCL